MSTSSRVIPTEQMSYLGYTFQGRKPRWSEGVFADFKHRVKGGKRQIGVGE